MQFDPIKHRLKPPPTNCLKVNCDVLLSTSALKFNLRRYKVVAEERDSLRRSDLIGRGVHSSTFQLNLSCF